MATKRKSIVVKRPRATRADLDRFKNSMSRKSAAKKGQFSITGEGFSTGTKKRGMPMPPQSGQVAPRPTARVQMRGPHWESGVIKVRKRKRSSSV